MQALRSVLHWNPGILESCPGGFCSFLASCPLSSRKSLFSRRRLETHHVPRSPEKLIAGDPIPILSTFSIADLNRILHRVIPSHPILSIDSSRSIISIDSIYSIISIDSISPIKIAVDFSLQNRSRFLYPISQCFSVL